jgi:hypothetical protein
MSANNNRTERLMPGGIPRYIRCYDYPASFDRYTVVYTGHYTQNTGGQFWYVGMSTYPFHPQGFGQHGESDRPIDRPAYGHLGKKISFNDLPDDCKKLVIQDYTALWNIS